MTDVAPILDDLAGEGRHIDDMVGALDASAWASPTPAPGWTIAHQIAHLAWTDQKSLFAVRRPEDFPDEVRRAMAEGESFVDSGAAAGAAEPPDVLLARWRQGRGELAAALRAVPEGTKLPWFGPPMSAASMTTARLMETWAHGQDIADTLGVAHEPGPRLWQIARFGLRTRDFAFALHSLEAPREQFRLELTAPDGELWSFGPPDADQRVRGSALDFCLLVTQRRHRDDTDLLAQGEQAETWLDIAQAFAGRPGNGRKAGQFG